MTKTTNGLQLGLGGDQPGQAVDVIFCKIIAVFIMMLRRWQDHCEILPKLRIEGAKKARIMKRLLFGL